MGLLLDVILGMQLNNCKLSYYYYYQATSAIIATKHEMMFLST